MKKIALIALLGFGISLNAQEYTVSIAAKSNGDVSEMIHLSNYSKKYNVLNITEDKVYIAAQEFDITSKEEFLARESDNMTYIVMNLSKDKLGRNTKVVVMKMKSYTSVEILQFDEQFNRSYYMRIDGLKQK